jgi:hypothetical protein
METKNSVNGSPSLRSTIDFPMVVRARGRERLATPFARPHNRHSDGGFKLLF